MTAARIRIERSPVRKLKLNFFLVLLAVSAMADPVQDQRQSDARLPEGVRVVWDRPDRSFARRNVGLLQGPRMLARDHGLHAKRLPDLVYPSDVEHHYPG